MRLPQLTDEYTTREVTAAFSGYNHNLIIADGEFHDLEGVSLDDYPAIGSRGPRGKVRPIADVNLGIGHAVLLQWRFQHRLDRNRRAQAVRQYGFLYPDLAGRKVL